MGETLFAAIVGAVIGGGLLIIWQWWWERRTRWIEHRRVAHVKMLFAIDDFIGTATNVGPTSGSEPLAGAGRGLYRAWTEFRNVAPTKGNIVIAADAALALALNIAATAMTEPSTTPNEWEALVGELLESRTAFFDAIRAHLGLGEIEQDPFAHSRMKRAAPEMRRTRASCSQPTEMPRQRPARWGVPLATAISPQTTHWTW